MTRQRTTDSRQAFTLLELMLVVFIVAILAALLLPVLSKAKGRARQIECLNQLRQVGLAARVFAHDHGDRFPFQVPVREGGTLELVQAASGLGGDVQFAFRHFQTLSNDLVFPGMLACPADSRTNASSFSQLRNDHISYFIAVTAELARPDSVLGGDRNIIARDGTSGSILRIGGATEVMWSRGGHEYRGNLLFAGGHVERTGNAGLQVAMRSATGPVSAWLPVASPSGSVSASPSGGSGSGGAAGGGAAGGRTGGGAASSGFAALQNFFTAPTPSGQSAPEAPPSSPVVAVLPPAKPVPQPPPVAPVAPPVPAPEPVVKQMAEAKAPAPVVAAEPLVEPTAAVNDEPAPSVLLIFVEPERCWWCWVLFLLVCVAASVTLGVLIQRRKEKRVREAAQAGGSTAASLRPAAS
jgi:prepilin-type N-terminal cleavage/methylation domain-containing protein/prepilin-type processing-associated H-X9-DG protein